MTIASLLIQKLSSAINVQVGIISIGIWPILQLLTQMTQSMGSNNPFALNAQLLTAKNALRNVILSKVYIERHV
jgi:hypothetical protein